MIWYEMQAAKKEESGRKGRYRTGDGFGEVLPVAGWLWN